MTTNVANRTWESDVRAYWLIRTEQQIYVRDGWWMILGKFFQVLAKNGYSNVITLVDAKEKFGDLRISLNMPYPYPEEVQRLLALTEYEASFTCDRCGQDGKKRTVGGYIFTCCQSCWETEVKKRKQQKVPF